MTTCLCNLPKKQNKKLQSGACCCGGPRTTVKDGEEVRQEIMAPKILLCATMWHENEKEMLALLKSIFNMDADQRS